MLKGETIQRGTIGILSGFLIAALTSCKVGPNYERPSLDVPTTYEGAASQPTTASTKAAATTTAPAVAHLDPDWWRVFNDPTLNQLESAAIENNQDLKAAIANVLAARASARITKSQFYPTITGDPSYTRSRESDNAFKGGPVDSHSPEQNDYHIPFDLTYEVDVWGRVRRAYEASKAQLQASADDFEVVLQTLEADVASDYFNLRSFDTQYDIVVENVASYDKQLQILKTQQKHGLVSSLDVLQAQALRDTVVSTEHELQRQRDDTEHALAILVGRPPSELSIPHAQFPMIPPEIPAGIPSELLRRRPDVAEAEQNLIAANANVGVSTADFFPVFTIIGEAGFESFDLQHLLDWQSRMWALGPNISFPVFEGGKLTAQLELSKQQYNQTLANYRQQVLTAFQDVEDSLSDLHHYAQEAHDTDIAVDSSQEYLHLSNVQYRNGIVSYLTVIDAERILLTNQIASAQITNNRLVSTVLFMKALGGGWDSANPAASQPAIPHYDPVSATRP